jgi:hypothetical protein
VETDQAQTTPPEQTTPARPGPQGWRDLPDDIRAHLRVNFPRKSVDPAHAQAAVDYARWRRRRVRRVVWALVVLVAAAFAWYGYRSSVNVSLVVAGVAAVLCIGGLSGYAHAALESNHLAASLAGVVAGTATPLAIAWRHGRARRAAHAVLVALLIATALVAAAFYDVRGAVVDAVLVAVILGRRAYTWPWPLASSYPHLAMLDNEGLHVYPLGITVPWHRVTRVRFGPGLTGVDVFWHVDDPVAIVAEVAASPAYKRRLVRWLTSHGSAIRLSAWQMRNAPADVYVASARYRDRRFGA